MDDLSEAVGELFAEADAIGAGPLRNWKATRTGFVLHRGSFRPSLPSWTETTTCVGCGKPFVQVRQGKRNPSTVCSIRCRLRPLQTGLLACSACGKEFRFVRRGGAPRRYCSDRCRRDAWLLRRRQR